jgi:hypothetical protein
VEDLMVNHTTATADALKEQANEQRETRARYPDYPGAEARHFNRFWLRKEARKNEATVIFIENPIQILAYRTVVEARKSAKGMWPNDVIHRSIRYYPAVVNGITVRKVRESETDLYADVFGNVVESWIIIPALVQYPQYTELGKRAKFPPGHEKAGKPAYYEAFRFIELGPGSQALEPIRRAMEHKFFSKSGQGLVGSVWSVTKEGKSPPADGHWTLKTRNTDTGTEYMQHPIKKLLTYVVDQANKEVSQEDYDRGVRKLHVRTFDEAYPLASVEQQRKVLQLHADLLEQYPKFDRRFPAMIKRIDTDGQVVGSVSLDDDDDEVSAPEGAVASLDDLDDASEPDFGDDEEAEEPGETETDDDDDVDDSDEDEVEETDDSDDSDDSDASDDSDDSDDDAGEVSASTDTTEEAGIADEAGDVNAFDFTNDADPAEVEKAKKKKKAVGKQTVKKVVKK